MNIVNESSLHSLRRNTANINEQNKYKEGKNRKNN